MRSGELLIYKGDFVDVDPNVRYSIEDFDEKEYFLFRAGENIHDRNNVKSMFGMAMELLVEGYNLVKVKYDFRMNGAISVMSDDKKEVKFIDSADKVAIIGKDKIKPYLNKSVKIYYVVRKKEIADLGTATVVHDYLTENMLMHRGIVVKNGCHYLLTEEQINHIDKLVYGLDLRKHYDKENPQIFAYFAKFDR